MSTTQAITAEVRQIISNILDFPEDDLKSETEINSLPNIDSMRTLEIILQVENKYGIEIPDNLTFTVKTIGEFEQIIQKLVQQR